MKVLITGAAGQLGRALVKTAPPKAQLTALTRTELDLADGAAIATTITDKRPDLIINAAAYTAVDKAESETALARAINADAPGQLACAAQQVGARFVHISTDFVFSGNSSSPYLPDSPTAPLGVYGETKLAGEIAVRTHCSDALILRTAWVYAAQGQNFVNTMLRLMETRDEVRVVADQIGTPTHADSLAGAIWKLAAANAGGILHWTDAGVASWYDFAVAIQEEASKLDLLSRIVPVVPIATSDYPTPARRPAMSVLDKRATWAVTGHARHWRQELRAALRQIQR